MRNTHRTLHHLALHEANRALFIDLGVEASVQVAVAAHPDDVDLEESANEYIDLLSCFQVEQI